MPLHDAPCMWPQEGCRCPPGPSQAEQDFKRWLTEAAAGTERPYPDSIEELVSRAAVARMVARGWNNRMGRFAVRLSNKLGEGLDNGTGT